MKEVVVVLLVVSWLACGFIGRCLGKNQIVKEFEPTLGQAAWDLTSEVGADLMVVFGPIYLGSTVLFVATHSNDPDDSMRQHWGLMW